MKTILEYIEHKRRRIGQHPFFAFVRDGRIDPCERLAFAPYIAPFVFGAQDLFAFVLSDAQSRDPYQIMVNQHCREEQGHEELYLSDLRAIGIGDFNESLALVERLWGNKTRRARQLILGLTAATAGANAKTRLIVLESMESMAMVGFEFFRKVAEDFQAATGRELVYFSGPHVQLEAGHTLHSGTVGPGQSQLHEIPFTVDEEARGRACVDHVFALFEAMLDEMLANAQCAKKTAA